MAGSANDQETRSGIERHLNTLALAIILAVVTWVGSTVVQVDKRTAVIEESIRSLKELSSSYYPAATAARDHADTSRRLDRLENRLDQMDVRAQRDSDRYEAQRDTAATDRELHRP